MRGLLLVVGVAALVVAAAAVTSRDADVLDAAVDAADADATVSFAALTESADAERLGLHAHAAEHASIAARVHRANALAAATMAADTEAQASAQVSAEAAVHAARARLAAIERDPSVAEMDKLVARLHHATHTAGMAGGEPHFFADSFYLNSLRSRARNDSPRFAQALDSLAVDDAAEDAADLDASDAVADAADAVDAADAAAEAAGSDSGSSRDGALEDAQYDAVLTAFANGDLDAAADLAASDLALFEAEADANVEADADAEEDVVEGEDADAEYESAADVISDLRFRAQHFREGAWKPRPKAVPKSDAGKDAQAKRPDMRGGTRKHRRNRKHRKHSKAQGKGKGKGKRPTAAKSKAAAKKAKLAAAKAAREKRLAAEARAGAKRSKLAAATIKALTAAKGQAVPSLAAFRALLARKNTPGHGAPSETLCDVGLIVHALESWHGHKHPAVRTTKPSGVGRKKGFSIAAAMRLPGLTAAARDAAVEDAQLNALIDAVDDWFVTRLPSLDLHVAAHAPQSGCKNLNVQAIALLKIIALNRLGVAERAPVGSPNGFEEMVCRLRGRALWEWFDAHTRDVATKPAGAGAKWLIELEGKLRFGPDHIGERDPALTLLFLTLRQLGPEYRGRLVIRLLTLPGITYEGVVPARRAVVQAESERMLAPLFSNLRVATRFLLQKVYFAILSAQRKLTELLPNLEGVKVGNLRSRTWASVRGVGGATAYFSKGKLVVPPLQDGWTQKTIPSVPEQTLQAPPNGLGPNDPLPEGWIKMPKEDKSGDVEWYHEEWPPLVEFTDGNQTLEGYERPVQCDPPYCAALQMAVFPEENLLNNETLVPAKLLDDVEHGYAQGYSIATHEMAHCVDMNGLHSKQHTLLNDEYERKMQANAIFTDGYRDPKKRITRGCYASHTVFEYFAQLTNTWLGTNHGLDPHFSVCSGPSRCKKVAPNDLAGCAAIKGCDSEHFPRANTQQWVVSHESPAITNLLWSLYGRARLVSFPVVMSAGFGYVYSPELSRSVKFDGVYFEVDKTRKLLAVFKSQPSGAPGAAGSAAPLKPALVVPLRGAGNAIWEESAGPRVLWRRRPDDDLECLVLTTVRKRHFYLCQRDVEPLLTALNEAIFMA